METGKEKLDYDKFLTYLSDAEIGNNINVEDIIIKLKKDQNL